MTPGQPPPPLAGLRRRGKEIPRLPLSAFSPPNTSTSDTFPLPPTPSLITPTAIVDAHIHLSLNPAGEYNADIRHLVPSPRRAIVLSPTGHPAQAILNSLQSLQSNVIDARVLSVLIPFALDSADIPEYLSAADALPGLATVYDGATSVAAESEDGEDQTHVETPVQHVRWALQHARVVDIDIKGGIMDTGASFYDSFVNLLAKAIKSDNSTKPTPIVLTNVLPPPLDAITPVVTMMNNPTYATYRQRVSLLSLSGSVCVKLLPPAWVPTAPLAQLDSKQVKEFRDILKLFIVPVLEAYGFERIIFGSSPVAGGGSSVLSENWYTLVLESFRELAVSQEEMDKIFVDNAERVYGAT